MNAPTMLAPSSVSPETTLLPAYLPVPGMGVLPVNAFVIGGESPVLVDTGLAALRSEFMAALRSTVDLEALAWVWLTHVDPDHAGNLAAVLAEAPRARVVTTFLGMGKMGLHGFPLDRVYLLNPGQALELGDRSLTALTPPSFDAPETTGLFDSQTKALFSSDCFGALLDEPAVDAADVGARALREGSISWGAIDAPWLANVEARAFADSVDALRRFAPRVVLGSHLPPARGMLEDLVGHLASVRSAPRFVGPDQAALERMMTAAA